MMKVSKLIFVLLVLSAVTCHGAESEMKVIREPSGRLSLSDKDLATLLSHNKRVDKANAEFEEAYQELLKQLEETRRSLRCS